MIRSSTYVLDEAFCAIQGYAGAYAINTLQGTKVFSPLNAAVCFAGAAFTEKLIYRLSRKIIPGSTASLGPIPIGTKNVVSHGLAIYLTLKVMQVAGLILNVPRALTIIGLGCAAALAVYGIKRMIPPKSISAHDHLHNHLQSKTFANGVFYFDHENKRFYIRVICNPEKKDVDFKINDSKTIACQGAVYILACNETIPEAFFQKFQPLAQALVWTRKMFDMDPLDYTFDPKISPVYV